MHVYIDLIYYRACQVLQIYRISSPRPPPRPSSPPIPSNATGKLPHHWSPEEAPYLCFHSLSSKCCCDWDIMGLCSNSSSSTGGGHHCRHWQMPMLLRYHHLLPPECPIIALCRRSSSQMQKPSSLSSIHGLPMEGELQLLGHWRIPKMCDHGGERST